MKVGLLVVTPIAFTYCKMIGTAASEDWKTRVERWLQANCLGAIWRRSQKLRSLLEPPTRQCGLGVRFTLKRSSDSLARMVSQSTTVSPVVRSPLVNTSDRTSPGDNVELKRVRAPPPIDVDLERYIPSQSQAVYHVESSRGENELSSPGTRTANSRVLVVDEVLDGCQIEGSLEAGDVVGLGYSILS